MGVVLLHPSNDELINLIKKIKTFIESPNTNVVWSRYNTVEGVLNHLDSLLKGLQLGDKSVIKELKILLGPTGSLQEISINNGWSADFVEITSHFDELVRNYK